MEKRVIIKSMTIENFKGRSMSMTFNAPRSVLRGKNESGKSTLTNAFFWLIMGVDAQDRTNYELYDSTREFTPENAVSVVVEGVFDIDGVECTLKRTAKQKWIRPRGESEYKKGTSDEYTFYIDGLAVSAGVYKDRIESMFAPMEKLKLMLNVRHYLTLDWKKLRQHFADMVGIIDDSELKGDYTAIAGLLARYGTVDAAKEKLRQEIAPIKKVDETITAEIKGMKSMLPTLDGIEEAEKRMVGLKSRIAEIDKEIVGLGEQNKPFIEKRQQEEINISFCRRKLNDERLKWDDRQGKATEKIKQQLNDVQGKNAEIRNENLRLNQQKMLLTRDIERSQQQYEFLDGELKRLRSENESIKARTFDENQICPSCGQPLPYDKVAEIRNRFNEKRKADHADCVERGLKMKEQVDNLEKAILEKKTQLAAFPEPKQVISTEDLEVQLAAAQAAIIPFEQSDIYARLTKEIADKEANLTVVPEINSSALIAEKEAINKEVSELVAIIGRRAERERGEKNIAKKEAEKTEVGVELARLEGLYDKCVEREREWASIVRDRANRYLHYAHVEMTEIKKDGGLVDACTLTARKVSSGSQNNATQIRIGADVARAFQINAGLSLPIFLDNAEGIDDDNLPDTDNQLIALYRDGNYSSLTLV